MTVREELERPTPKSRRLIPAADIRVSDYIPLLGRVVEVVVTDDDVTITTVFNLPVVIRLSPETPLWIDRYQQEEVGR